METETRPRSSLLPLVLLTLILVASVGDEAHAQTSSRDPSARQQRGCTIFTASVGGSVLFGNNEDYPAHSTDEHNIRVLPTEPDRYGAVLWFYKDIGAQGGVNEAGLAIDNNALPPRELVLRDDLPPFPEDVIISTLRDCATVEEAIAYTQQHRWWSPLSLQLHVADAEGDAVVISANQDGGLTYTRKAPGEGYLVSTNFNLGDPTNSLGPYPDFRYDIVSSMLEGFLANHELRVEDAAGILKEFHAQGESGTTQYSQVVDLRNGVIHLYHWHNFDEVASLRIEDVVATNTPPRPIRDFFSPESVEESDAELLLYQSAVRVRKSVSTGVLILTVGSLAAMLAVQMRRPRLPLWRFLPHMINTLVYHVFGLSAYLLMRRSISKPVAEGPTAIARAFPTALFHSSISFLILAAGARIFDVFYIFSVYERQGLLPAQDRFLGFVFVFAGGLIIVQLPFALRRGGRTCSTILYCVLIEAASSLMLFALVLVFNFVANPIWRHGGMLLSPALIRLSYSLASFLILATLFPFHLWFAKRKLPDGARMLMEDSPGTFPESLPFQSAGRSLLLSVLAFAGSVWFSVGCSV